MAIEDGRSHPSKRGLLEGMLPQLWVRSTSGEVDVGSKGLASEAAGDAVRIAQFAPCSGGEECWIRSHGIDTVLEELLVGEHFEASIVVLDPVAAVKVVHVSKLLVRRAVDVSIDDAPIVVLAGQMLELFFIFVHKGNSRFCLGFDPSAEGAVRKFPLCPVAIVDQVQAHGGLICDITDDG